MDILHQLRLTDQSSTDSPQEKTASPQTTYTNVPPFLNAPVSGYGVLLDTNSIYEIPASNLFHTEFSDEFSFVISLSSWGASNAFLLSVKDGGDRLHFGIQLLPHRLVVYTAEQSSIHFTYSWQDGQQHAFAVGVRARSVSFYTDCGRVQQREQTLARAQTLGKPGSLFTLGRMNSKAAPFSGQLCQLDIYPSAQAAAHYCNYLKKQCRLADTYRSPLPHSRLDIKANNPPVNSSPKSRLGVPSIHHTSTKVTTADRVLSQRNQLVTQFSTWSPTTQLHLREPKHISTLKPLSLQPEHHTQAPPKRQAMLDLSHSTSITTNKNVLATGKGHQPQRDIDQFENSTEEDSRSWNHQTSQVFPSLISPIRQSQVKEGHRNSLEDSELWPKDTHHVLEFHRRANSTTLYRENRVDTSEQHELDGSYEDTDLGEYDYGYEEPEFLYDYEDGFNGPKGEPGPPVSG